MCPCIAIYLEHCMIYWKYRQHDFGSLIKNTQFFPPNRIYKSLPKQALKLHWFLNKWGRVVFKVGQDLLGFSVYLMALQGLGKGEKNKSQPLFQIVFKIYGEQFYCLTGKVRESTKKNFLPIFKNCKKIDLRYNYHCIPGYFWGGFREGKDNRGVACRNLKG